MAGMWARVTGRGPASKSKTLSADLKRITHSDLIDIPKELFAPVIEASRSEDDRAEIMRHLRACLAEASGKQWRRVYGGLVLADELVKNGSSALLAETAEGFHFDLLQRLSFLEHFDSTDKRAANMVRAKAETLRKELVPLLESASLRDAEDVRDTASTCSPGAASTMTRSTTASSATGFGSDDVSNVLGAEQAEARKLTMVLNNIVTVGHSDDTTSESDGGDQARAAVEYRETRKMTARARNERSRRGGGCSPAKSDVGAPDHAPQSIPTAQTHPQSVSLLDF